MIQVKNVSKFFNTLEVLKNINLEIKKGSQSVIQGASGSGKSTLLYIMGGIDTPTSGKIFFQGSDLAIMKDDELSRLRNTHIGFVFQFHFLLPQMTCLDNIYLPSRIYKKHKEPSLIKRVNHLTDYLGVTHCLGKYPSQISGGEQQRVNIVRALSQNPSLLLCDEPTGNLDSANSQKVVSLLKEIAKENNTTLVMVTHDPIIASHYEDKIFIEDGQIKR